MTDVDYPTAWRIARETPVPEHEHLCSFAQTGGGVLCDCRVLTQHPLYLAHANNQTWH